MRTKQLLPALTSVLLVSGCHSFQRRIDHMSFVQPKLHQPAPVSQLLATNILKLIDSAKALQNNNDRGTALEGLISSAEALHNRKISSSRQPPNSDQAIGKLVQAVVALQTATNTMSGQTNSLPQLTQF